MSDWESQWQKDARRAREKASRSEFGKMLRTTLWAILIIAAAMWTFLTLRNNNFQIVIKTGADDVTAQAPRTGQRSSQQPTQTQPETNYQQPPAPPTYYETPAQTPPVVHKRTVQEEYEMASRIMESTTQLNRAAQAASNRVSYGGYYFDDQMSFDRWWLNNLERICLSQVVGSINYRDCRANVKGNALDECRQRKLRFEGLPSQQRDQTRPINEAQCYAANNYRIVE